MLTHPVFLYVPFYTPRQCVTYLLWIHRSHSICHWYDAFNVSHIALAMCDMTHSYVWHDSFICVTWLIHMSHSICHWYDAFNVSHIALAMCDMTHSYVWHDSFICVPWLIHMCATIHAYVWHDWFMCVTWLNTNRYLECPTPRARECVTHWCRSLCVYVTWLIHLCDTLMLLTVYVCDMTYSLVWHADAAHCVGVSHDPSICVTCWCHSLCVCATWLIHLCDMTYSYVWHDSCVCVTWLISHICTSHVAQSFVCVTHWCRSLCVCDSSQIWQTDRLCGCVCVWVCVHVYMRINERVTHTHTTRVWQVCDTMTQLSLIDASVTHRDSYIWFVTQVCDYDTSVADRLCACVCVYTCMRINERVTHTHMTRTYVAHWSTCVT